MAAPIDTNDQAAVLAAWDTIMSSKPALAFDGSVAGCTSGSSGVSAAYRASTLAQLNAFRNLAGSTTPSRTPPGQTRPGTRR